MLNTLVARATALAHDFGVTEHIYLGIQFTQVFRDEDTASLVYVIIDVACYSAITCGLGELDIPTAMGILQNMDHTMLLDSCLLTTWTLPELLPYAHIFPDLVPLIVPFDATLDPGYPDLIMALRDRMTNYADISNHLCDDLLDGSVTFSDPESEDSALGLGD